MSFSHRWITVDFWKIRSMKLIKSLTKKQVALLPVYRDKWLKVGLSCESFSFERAKNIVDTFYKRILGKGSPKAIIVMDNPIDTWYATVYLHQVSSQVWGQVRNQVESQVNSQVWSQVESQVSSQVRDQIWDQVESQVSSQVWSQVESQVSSQVWGQVRNQVKGQVRNQVKGQVCNQVWGQVRGQVWDQVSSQVWGQVRNQVRNQVRDQVESQGVTFVWPYLDGSFWASYLSFYDFFFKEAIPCHCSNWAVFKSISELSLVYPLDNFCVLCQKPTAIRMSNGLLHSAGSPAVAYGERFKMWCLNGVRVPQWLVETRAEEIDPMRVLSLENAQQRAEGIKKVGIERVWYKCCTTILDRKGTYELGLIPIAKNGKLWPYLKMKNPSVPELWHVEGIPDKSCKTVEQALNSRKPKKMKNIPVSENGEDWYQQGDVYVWPRNAKLLKPFPVILT